MDYRSDLSWMDDSYSLTHWGILGMKWGRRRFQPYGSGGYMPKGMAVASNGEVHRTVSDSTLKEMSSATGNRVGHGPTGMSAKANRELEKERREYIKNAKVQSNKDAEKAAAAREKAKDKLYETYDVVTDAQELNTKGKEIRDKKILKKVAKMSDEELHAEIEKYCEESERFRKRADLENMYINTTAYQRQEKLGQKVIHELLYTLREVTGLAKTGIDVVNDVKAVIAGMAMMDISKKSLDTLKNDTLKFGSQVDRMINTASDKRANRKASKMSDDELVKAISEAEEKNKEIKQRLDLENTYINTTAYQRQESIGSHKINEIMETTSDYMELAIVGNSVYKNGRILLGV